ncbi:MAG: hypothetical protein WAK22_03295 [Candidatus Sulfotelmatobacter sp.]
MDPSLMIVGVNFATAPVFVRDRFLVPENRRHEALEQLSRTEGIDEVILLATRDRTEFLLWATDITLAANSVMRFLSSEYGLKLAEWEHFYRLLDEAALLHIFRIGCGLDAMKVVEPQITSQLEEAWKQAQAAGTAGRCLDAVIQKAFTVSKRIPRSLGPGKLKGVVDHKTSDPEDDAEEAEKILRAEAQDFRRTLAAQRVAPTIVALRHRLDEICRQELDSYRQENGPFTQDQDEMLSAVMSRITQRITASLARELKELPEQVEQEQLTTAVQRLFHLPTPQTALAGTSL